jgi:ATP-binding cassette subfamily B protein
VPASDARGHETPHFRIHCPPGSFAERSLGQVAGRLEAFYDASVHVLRVDEALPADQGRVDVYLAELPGKSGDARPPTAIYELYSPESPGVGLDRAQLLILLDRITGKRPVPPFIVDGLMAEIVQRLRSLRPSVSPPPGGAPPNRPPAPGARPPGPALAPGVDPRMAALLQAKSADRLPPLKTLLGGPNPATRPLYFAAASTFVGFLLRSYGPAKFRLFIAQLGAETPDGAARHAYGRSFADVEKEWRKTLKAVDVGGVIALLRRVSPYLAARWPKVVEIVLEIAATVAFTTFVATQQQRLMDQGILQGNLGVVGQVIAQLLVLFAIVSVLSLRQNYATAQLAQSVLRDIRLRMFALVQRLESAFFQTMPAGDLLTRMTSDLSSLETTIGVGLAQGARTVLMIIIPGAALIQLNLRFGLVLLIATPLFFVAGRYFGPLTARASRTRQQDLAALTSLAQEDLAAQSVVRAFGLEDMLVQRYARELGTFMRSALRLSILSGLTGLTAQSITVAIQLTALGVGAWLVVARDSTPLSAWFNADGQITPGTVGAILALMAQIVGAVQGMNSLLQMFQQATGPMDRVNELLESQPKIGDAPNASPVPRLADAIRLQEVWFGYDANQPVLRNVNLVIPSGSTVGLVGPSGSGKSTVLGLLQRSYDPQRGRITADSVDLRQATLASLRGQESMVFQESVLFNVSIRENIRMGKLDATDAEVEEAARKAEIHDMIASLPDGYETLAGERGGRLSGGQRQRVAIARAIVRDPAVLLLDEATSALDPATEAAINATLRSVSQGRTTVSVTHRLASVLHADILYVLDRGTVVEQGTHAELLERGGLYAGLWKEQTGAAGAPGVGPEGTDAARLQKVPLFAGVPLVELIGLARQLHAERFAAGDEIIRQGNSGDKLYLLERGQVEVVVTDASGLERQLAMLREGDYFGDVALLHDVQRTASVRALTPVLVDSLGKSDFMRELEHVPELRERMEQTILRRAAPGAATVPTPVASATPPSPNGAQAHA